MKKESISYRIGADIGGTFTDIVILTSDGTIHQTKLLSTTMDYAQAVIMGLKAILDEISLESMLIENVRHGTTVATNAILELKGARTGLVTTKGFRDILEIRQQRHKRDPETTHGIDLQLPPPLVPRALRLEVDERINYAGEILKPVNLIEARSVIQHLVNKRVDSIAVCLLNSYANAIHEQKIGELIRKEFSHLYLSLSSDILPQIREYERTSTTVINSFLGPIVRNYLNSLEKELKNIGVTVPLLVMQSSGGIMGVDEAILKPIHIMESGPAAGVIASAQLANICGFNEVITLDMGGTTAKTSIIEDGNINRRYEYNVGGGITVGARWLGGVGYPLSVPSIDIAEVGAGGGSIIWLDEGGLMQVGPHSAGPAPGPACYNMGGTEPTVTDANVILGYLNPSYLVGGSLQLISDKAYLSMEPIAKHLDLSLHEVAYGAHLIANANMARAVKAVSSENGKDPRGYTLFAFGGSGPVHGAGLAKSLGMKRVLIPMFPGLFSALGLIFAEAEHNFTRTFMVKTRDIAFGLINQVFNKMREEALAVLHSEGYDGEKIELQHFIDLRYVGQSSELTIPMKSGIIDKDTLSLLEQEFFMEYERIYGLRHTGEPVEIVNLRLKAVGKRDHFFHFARLNEIKSKISEQGKSVSKRKVYFGPDFGFLNTPVLNRFDLSLKPQKGPIIIEEYDSTVVIHPLCKVWIDEFSNIIAVYES